MKFNDEFINCHHITEDKWQAHAVFTLMIKNEERAFALCRYCWERLMIVFVKDFISDILGTLLGNLRITKSFVDIIRSISKEMKARSE